MLKKVLAVNLGGLDSTASGAGYEPNTLSDIIGSGVGIVLGLVGVLFLALMITGGIIWMTAGGNETRVGTAKKLILAAVIGLLIVLSAYAITAWLGGGPININQ